MFVYWLSVFGDSDNGILFLVVNFVEVDGQIYCEIKKFINDYDIIVVDCLLLIIEKVFGVVLLVVLIVVILMLLLLVDYWLSVGLVKLIQQVQVMNEDFCVVFLLNKIEEKCMLICEFKCVFEEFGFLLLKMQILIWEVYKQVMVFGQIVLQMNDCGGKLVVVEICVCVDEIVVMLF